MPQTNLDSSIPTQTVFDESSFLSDILHCEDQANNVPPSSIDNIISTQTDIDISITTIPLPVMEKEICKQSDQSKPVAYPQLNPCEQVVYQDELTNNVYPSLQQCEEHVDQNSLIFLTANENVSAISCSLPTQPELVHGSLQAHEVAANLTPLGIYDGILPSHITFHTSQSNVKKDTGMQTDYNDSIIYSQLISCEHNNFHDEFGNCIAKSSVDDNILSEEFSVCSSLSIASNDLVSGMKYNSSTQTNPFSCKRCPYFTNDPNYVHKHNRQLWSLLTEDVTSDTGSSLYISGTEPIILDAMWETTRNINIEKLSQIGTGPISVKVPIIDQSIEMKNKIKKSKKSVSEQKTMSEASSNKKKQVSLTCLTCNKTFTRFSSLTRHQLLHDRTFTCSECNDTFSDYSSFKLHQRGHRSLECTICDKVFRNYFSLMRHKRLHTVERPYACGECGATFKFSDDLTHHKRTHNNEKPFACSVCGKTFSFSSSLTRHEHAHSNEKPYACTVCGKTFSQAGNLSRHRRKHAEDSSENITENADEKSKSGPQEINLPLKEVQKQIMNASKKPFACAACKKSFCQVGNLSRHKCKLVDKLLEQTSKGKGKYDCAICAKNFRQIGNLSRHRRKHSIISSNDIKNSRKNDKS